MAADLPSNDPDAADSPDVLVIEDRALVFRDTPKLWPAALSKNGRPNNIIVSTGQPLLKGELWGKSF